MLLPRTVTNRDSIWPGRGTRLETLEHPWQMRPTVWTGVPLRRQWKRQTGIRHDLFLADHVPNDSDRRKSSITLPGSPGHGLHRQGFAEMGRGRVPGRRSEFGLRASSCVLKADLRGFPRGRRRIGKERSKMMRAVGLRIPSFSGGA